MPGKQAKILSRQQAAVLLAYASTTRYPARNRLVILLSVNAGLRAGEIAGLTWDMVVDATGEIAAVIEVRDCVAKKGSGRVIPMHSDLRSALAEWGTSHLYHACCAPRSSGWRLSARRAAARGASVDADHAAVH